MNVLITAGASIEKIDPVRYLSNFSSGKQGYCIAKSLALSSYNVKLILANNSLGEINKIKNLQITKVDSCQEMLRAVRKALAVKSYDAFISTAAVSDYRVKTFKHKLKSDKTQKSTISLRLILNPDILATVSKMKKHRPKLVIGFCAETKNLLAFAKEKLQNKGCDWIIANNVLNDVFNSDFNQVYFLSKCNDKDILVDKWPRLTKTEVGMKLSKKISNYFSNKNF